MFRDMIGAFMQGWYARTYNNVQQSHHQEKQMRNELEEQQVDHMVEDSFPASDPPSTY